MKFSTAGLPPPAVWAALDEEFGTSLVDGRVWTVELRVTASAIELRGTWLARVLVARRVRKALVTVPWSADLEPDELAG